VLDTTHSVETPEGVRLVLRVAGPVPRLLAFLLDSSLRGLAYVGAAIALTSTLRDLAGPLIVLFVFACEWFYPVLFEVLGDGQTIGKRLVGLRVVHDDGTRIRLPASLLRNLLLAADMLPGTFAFALLSMLASRDFRRLGDHAAGTLVIHAGTVARRTAAPLPERAPLAPPLPLGVEEQRAVVAFAERAPRLSEARAAELAGLATPLLDGREPPAERLLRIAAWLRGAGADPAP
jgi:uncharacterized RDD family membrane protein YckC